MATAVLRPQDCTTKIPFVPADVMCGSRFVHRSKPARKPNSSPNSRRRRRSPSDEKGNGRERTEDVKKSVKEAKEAKELVMENVRILKRGDSLSPNLSEGKSRIDRGRSVRFEEEVDVILCSTDRLGPDPEVLKERIAVCEKKMMLEDRFAGCAFTPPPPSSLPMPMNYWLKKEKCDPTSMTTDLRRILRLDLI
ncbi:unnamed protein product [Rhodiola kirilowii]